MTKKREQALDFAELNDQVQTALGLLDSQTADVIIGEGDETHGLLITATRATMTLLWKLMKSFNVRETKQSLRGFSQAMVVMLTLVHYAYALGARREREAANSSEATGG